MLLRNAVETPDRRVRKLTVGWEADDCTVVSTVTRARSLRSAGKGTATILLVKLSLAVHAPTHWALRICFLRTILAAWKTRVYVAES